jgi:dihydroorotase
MPLEEIIDKFCAGPRRILGIEIPAIRRGAEAELTIFDPDIEWTYNGSRHSLSRNDALVGRTFTGKVIATVAKDRVAIN